MATTFEHKLAAGAENKPFMASVRTFFAAIGEGLVAYGEARSRSSEMSRLNAMSDAQLAKMGLRREDIARHVFRDILYL